MGQVPKGRGGLYLSFAVSLSSLHVLPFPNLESHRAGSGFKIHVEDLSSLTLNLGPHTTSPLASIGISMNYGKFITVNVSEGSNTIPLSSLQAEAGYKTSVGNVVRINVEGWQDNRINFENITLNSVETSILSLNRSVRSLRN